MKITIEIDTNKDARQYRAVGRLKVDEAGPLPLVFIENFADRDAYVESRWGDQSRRTLITQNVAKMLQALFKDHWHALQFAQAVSDEQVGG